MRVMYGVVMGTLAGLTMAVATAHAGNGALDGYAGAKVIESSGDKVVLAVDYAYSARAEADPTACTGTSQREFTLAKAGPAYEVSGMTGNTP